MPTTTLGIDLSPAVYGRQPGASQAPRRNRPELPARKGEPVAQQPRALDPAGSPEQLFGAQLRARRTALGLSQDALGRRVNFTGAVVGKWEKGRSLPDQASAVLLDRLLGDDSVLLASWRYAASHRAARDRELQPWQLMDVITRAQISGETLDMMGRAVLATAARYPSTPPDLLWPPAPRSRYPPNPPAWTSSTPPGSRGSPAPST